MIAPARHPRIDKPIETRRQIFDHTARLPSPRTGNGRHYPQSAAGPTFMREPWVDRYLRSQSAHLVDYAERHRAGLRVGTALTEGTANFLVNRRMAKAQQMRWTRRGADLL